MGEFKKGIINIKGVNAIKTTTGLVGAKRIRKSHEAYLELSSLEIEKHRLNVEKKNAETRIKVINKRFKEIDKKELALLKFIKKPNSDINEDNINHSAAEPFPTYCKSTENIRERIVTY